MLVWDLGSSACPSHCELVHLLFDQEASDSRFAPVQSVEDQQTRC